MARLSSELVLSLTDRVSGPARAIDRNLDGIQRRNLAVGRSARMAADDVGLMGRAGGMMLAPAAAALAPVGAALGGQQLVRAAADFESALTNIQKKAGSSAAETAALGEEIKALATSGELAVPIDEIAAAYERGAAAGIPLGELREFARLSSKASDAFEMSAEDVGNAAAGFSTVQGIPIDKMERYFDLINGLADAGIADESGIVDFIDQGGAMAKTFGFSAEQTAALGAALANLKVSASKGATATNSILTRLLAPDALSSAGRQAYNRLIKDDKRFRQQLENGKSAEAFVEIVDSLKALDKETRTGIIVDLFGQDHLDVMTQLVEGSDELKRNLAYAAGTDWFGSLDSSYKLKLNDFWSQWQIFKNEVERTLIDVGTMGMPALTRGLASARAIVREIGAGIDRMALDLDWDSIGRAKSAVGELHSAVTDLLGIDGSESLVAGFFRDLTKVVNDLAASVDTIQSKIAIAKESAIGQVLTGDETERAEGAQRLGSSIEPETGRLAPVPVKPGGLVPDLTDWFGRTSGAGALEGSQVERDRTERVGKSPDRQVADRFGEPAPAMDDALLQALRSRPSAPITLDAKPATGQPAAPTLRPTAVAASAPQLPNAIPVPTPRPDLDTEILRQAERAAQGAKDAGVQIQTALSVTATPHIDASSIRGAKADVDALAASLRAIPGLAQAASDAANSARADYSGIHADIEE